MALERKWVSWLENATILACKIRRSTVPYDILVFNSGHWWPVAMQKFLNLSIICGHQKFLNLSIICGHQKFLNLSIICGHQKFLNLSIICGHQKFLNLSIICGHQKFLNLSIICGHQNIFLEAKPMATFNYMIYCSQVCSCHEYGWNTADMMLDNQSYSISIQSFHEPLDKNICYFSWKGYRCKRTWKTTCI